ncbi:MULTISPECIES: MFS transporter [Staphylococcus]|uniref:Major facilitator family protein n=1 Tax=Staphylococcus saprophyticus TaxID=29385 RepID=A0A380HPC7_STASA|nr:MULTISPECIES: MFS transporter [Staphylococcus]EHY91427.1 major facilitator family protein [Staphylococcus saprophyticus subsp. saprophyticus KACC 16562]KIJ85934.1 MFS sugar transporter [Staphylococcus saprophyticus]MBF2777635.1 MFS transporter [Staphylococcus saprophyticus]MBN6203538.1 MFS transporter [Staphylococcus saprophyticus]MBO0381779.1 MFS transporter [Staphylococcus saprophyticus]
MRKNKFAILALAMSAFAIGMTEFISVGLLPLIKDSFNTTISLAGLTVSLYAVGVTIGAPLLTPLTNKIKRKHLLIGIMLIFIIANTLAAFSTTFSMLLAMRVLSALMHGVFMSIATAIASDLVSPDKRSSAIAMMFTGLTVATITGVPLGTWIGQQFGWEASFITIAIIGFLSLVINIISVPNDLNEYEQASMLEQLTVFKNKSLMMVYLITALGYGGTFVVYTYLTTLLTDTLHYSDDAVVILLVIYGVMVAIGNTLGGKLTNNRPMQVLIGIFLIQAIVLLIVGVTVSHQILGTIAILIMGLFAFMNVPGLQLIVVLFAERKNKATTNFASSLNIASFNIGITLGSVIGGYVLNHFSITMTPYFGFAMVLIASAMMYMVYKNEKSTELNIA